MSWRTGNGVDSEWVPRFYWAAVFFLWLLFRIFFRLRVYGRENVPRMGGCVIAANHASFLDPPILGTAIRFRAVRFMARDSLFRFRPFGWFLRRVLVIPLSRERGDVGAMRQGVATLKAGGALGVFPEGTRTPDGELKPAKGGIGFLIAKAGAPVVPVYIDGSYRALPRHRKWIRPARITVHIGRPITPDEVLTHGKDYEGVAARIMEAIAALRNAHMESVEKRSDRGAQKRPGSRADVEPRHEATSKTTI